MKKYILIIFIAIVAASCGDGIPQEEKDNAFWLDQADISVMDQDWAEPNINFSCDSNELSIGGKSYDRGVGTHAISKMMIKVHGYA
jgi:alpha-galactosidase